MAKLIRKGGKGSGNFGHAGRPGKVGGSSSDKAIQSGIADVSFGIMIGDLFGDIDPDEEGYDVEASVAEYAKLVTQAIKKRYGETVNVAWDSQYAGGAIPYNLRTMVNGDTDHDDVDDVDNIIHDVWEDWQWVVETA